MEGEEQNDLDIHMVLHITFAHQCVIFLSFYIFCRMQLCKL